MDALKRFQTDQNLPPDGKLTPLSLIAMDWVPGVRPALPVSPPVPYRRHRLFRLHPLPCSPTPPWPHKTRRERIRSGSHMIIGVPKEVKDNETRVGLVPGNVTALREAGHQVLIQ